MIYFDHNSTTIMHQDVRKFLISLMDKPLNPSSIHTYGRQAKAIIEEARDKLLNLVGINNNKEYNLIFTSSGTESNNLLLQNFKDADIFISEIEHLSIFGLKNYLQNIHLIKVNNNGVIDLENLENNLAKSISQRKLVSTMIANNETGVVQPVAKAAMIARKYGALMHSDLAQGVGKIAIDIKGLDLDFASVSAHKFGGPQGAGALIATTSCHIIPTIIGGGQERGARSGTENVIAIGGFGKAAELAKLELEVRHSKMKTLQEYLEQNISHGFEVVAADSPRLPNTTLLLAKNFTAQNLLMMLDLKNIMVSSGSACSSGKVGASRVLKAMNFSEEEAKSAIRISFSPYNSMEEVKHFIKICNELRTI